MIGATRIVEPAEAVVSLSEIKAHLAVEHNDDDGLLASYIEAATGLLDGPNGSLGRALVTQTWRVHVDEWPGSGRYIFDVPDVQSLVAIRYWADGTEQIADATTYWLNRGSIYPATGYSWPTLDSWGAEIDFVLGFGTAADVPAPIKHAIYLTVGAWYRVREEIIVGQTSAELPSSINIEGLVSRYRKMVV